MSSHDWSQHKKDLSDLRDENFTDENGVYDYGAANRAIKEAYSQERKSSRQKPVMSETTKCRLCGSPLNDLKPARNEDAVCVDCPRCGKRKVDRMEWDYINPLVAKDVNPR